MAGTGCTSPANLFSKSSPWRSYVKKVDGAHAWKLDASPDKTLVATGLEGEVPTGA
jgi:hypothetical protein